MIRKNDIVEVVDDSVREFGHFGIVRYHHYGIWLVFRGNGTLLGEFFDEQLRVIGPEHGPVRDSNL